MVIAIGLIPITNLLGGDQAAWIKLAVILGIVSTISLILTFLSNKEQNLAGDAGVKEAEEKLPFGTSIKLLFRNEYWLMMLGVMLLVNIIYALSGATGVYYAKWVLKDENLVAIMGAVGLIPVFIGFPLTGFLTKKLGLAKACRVALLIGGAGTLVRVFFPYNFMITMIFGSFATFGTIPLMAVGGVMVNNTVEYGQWKHGKRIVGMANSATGFATKISSGLGAAMIGWILAAGGYNGELAAQPQSAITSILAVSIWIPGIILVLLYVVLRFYDLDAKYPQIVKDLESRSVSNK
jgi:GPH family glycoside/pentoside/hexuronide:cation symporter